MILVTGDIHGEVHRVADAVARFGLGSEDTVVLLGDVGMNYYGNKRGDRHRKKRLNKLGVTMFCIHGNHEMRPETIVTYHEAQWHGGTVYVEDEFPTCSLPRMERFMILLARRPLSSAVHTPLINGTDCNVTCIGSRTNSPLLK